MSEQPLTVYAKSEQADMPAAEITEIVLEYERCAV